MLFRFLIVGLVTVLPIKGWSSCELPSAVTPLNKIPLLLQRAVIAAEDKRFYEHNGTDYRALAHALIQNVTHLGLIRGASSITEQLARIEGNYPRTFRGRLSTAIRAKELEGKLSKDEILERYLNRVAYPSNACGVREGALVLFGRDLSTLTPREMIALAVIIRAPSALDPRRNFKGLNKRINRLSKQLVEAKSVNQEDTSSALEWINRKEGVSLLRKATLDLQDNPLEREFRKLLAVKIERMKGQNVEDGAFLAIENSTGKILADLTVSKRFGSIDSVRTPRQPGSTLKPFLYAMALDREMNLNSIIEDAPLRIPVSGGIHRFRNYSGEYFGPVSLTEALGSSLNTPAVRVLQGIGVGSFLEQLHKLGFKSLDDTAAHYGEGLTLGDGEVTLFELVQGYRTFAMSGNFSPIGVSGESRSYPVMSNEAAEGVTKILIDPDARRHEFGVGGLLQFPIQTAVKTGTSGDHHDAWALGYSARFTVGVWMGNLDRTAMREVSGSRGPAWVLRAAFAKLEQEGEPKELLEFVPEVKPADRVRAKKDLHLPQIEIPAEGMIIKQDPRIPDDMEAIAFELDSDSGPAHWYLDGSEVGTSSVEKGRLVWKIAPGKHIVTAKINDVETKPVSFLVKN